MGYIPLQSSLIRKMREHQKTGILNPKERYSAEVNEMH